MHDIKEFGLNKGVYTWSQTLREGNQPADLVTTYGLQLQEQLRVFEFVPSFIFFAVHVLADLNSTVFPRVLVCFFEA